MAKSKILFCRFNHPVVEPLAEWNPKFKTQAEKCVRLHNDTVVKDNGEFDDEFWFLETTIKGKTKIITLATAHNYPENDPTIVAKLETYLARKDDNFDSSARNRGKYNK